MAATHPTGKHILLIEDDAATSEVLTLILQHEGHAVSSAANGVEALDHLHGKARPDVILLDLMMPVMCGREFRKRQKQDPALASIPVVIVSAATEIGQEAVALGAASYLAKPIEPLHLLATIRRVCSQGFREALAEAPTE
jgi:two-component system, chemotaxis family, chemotaxis protein CheY